MNVANSKVYGSKNEDKKVCKPADHNTEEEYCDLTDDMIMPVQVSFLAPSTLD